MIICIDCSPKTKDELDELLRAGQYRDYAEAVAVAVSNQLTLHRNMASAAMLIDTPARNSLDAKRNEQRRPDDIPSVLEVPRSAVPAAFSRIDLLPEHRERVALPNDAFTIGQPVTVDRWIFGQHNKLLPLKASVRAIAQLLLKTPSGVVLSQAGSFISSEAELLGAYLRTLDEKHGLMRDESLCTAFPSAATDINKSRLRFANQFVGNVSKGGILKGLPVDLKLVNFRSGKDPKLLLTEAGWHFALHVNPILDATESTDRLCADEREFLIQHIRTSVPVEDFAIRAVLAAVDKGNSSPEELDSALLGYLPESSEKTLSNAFVATQRAGVISRMGDLGLVNRVREGLRVFYQASERGKQYLDKAVGTRG